LQSLHTPKYDMFPREKNWVDVGGNSYSFGVFCLSSLRYPFSRIVHLRCQRPRRFGTLGFVGLGLSVWWASREFNPRFDENSWELILYFGATIKKFLANSCIFLAFLFTFEVFWGCPELINHLKKKQKTGLTLRLFPKFHFWLHNISTVVQLVQFMGTLSSFPPKKNAVIYHD
jgi:hypothetical protein